MKNLKRNILVMMLLGASFAFAEITMTEDLKVIGGTQVTGTNGFLLKPATTSSLAPAWAASFSGTASVNVLAWYPSKGAFRAGAFPANELTNINIGTGSFAVSGFALGENSVAFGGRVAAGAYNSFVQGSSSVYSPYSAAFGESLVGSLSSGAFAAGNSYADSPCAVAFGKAVVGRGGQSTYSFGIGESFIGRRSQHAFASGTAIIGNNAPFAVAMGEELCVSTSNTTVFGRANQSPVTGTSELTPLTSVWEIGIGDYKRISGAWLEMTGVENGRPYSYWVYTCSQSSGTRANAMTVLHNGKTTIANRYWDADNPQSVPSQTITISGQAKDAAGAGVALEVKGHAVFEGNVTMLRAQGDVPMDVFGGTTQGH